MKETWLDCNHDVPTTFDLPKGQVAIYSRRCPGKSTANEDAVLVIPLDDTRVVLAVADGCGGMHAGAEASRITLKALRRSIKKAKAADVSLRSAILDGIEAANAKVMKLGVGAATTLAVTEVTGERMRSYHIGDSQVVLVGGRGKVKLQTPAHSPVGYALEAGVLSEDEAMTHEDRHIVSNVVGTRECFIEVGMRRKMAKRDTLVLASDGIFDNLHVDEACDLIRNGQLETAATRLAQRAQERMNSPTCDDQPSKPDDATFVLFRR